MNHVNKKFRAKELKALPWDYYIELCCGYSAENVIWEIKDYLQSENVRLLFHYPRTQQNNYGLDGGDIYLEWIEYKNRKMCRFLPSHSIYQVLKENKRTENKWLLYQLQ